MNNHTVKIQFLQRAVTSERLYKIGDVADWDSVEAERFAVAGIAKIIGSPPPENMIEKMERAEIFRHNRKGKRK